MISNITGAATGLMVVFLTYLAWPEPPFLRVVEMRVVDGQVIITREIGTQKTVADWVVTIVGDGIDPPSCQTVTGPDLHQGWSVYDVTETPSGTRSFPLDVWVGQEGCADRLTPGEYDMFVTWTPRDGREPVTAKTHFTIG